MFHIRMWLCLVHQGEYGSHLYHVIWLLSRHYSDRHDNSLQCPVAAAHTGSGSATSFMRTLKISPSHVFDTQYGVAADMTQAPTVSRSIRSLLITLYHSAKPFLFSSYRCHFKCKGVVQKAGAQCHRRVGKQCTA